MTIGRRKWLKSTSLISISFLLSKFSNAFQHSLRFVSNKLKIQSSDFNTFIWGTACAAFQVEGSPNIDGKGPSIWDTFTKKKKHIKDKSNANEACDFYRRYEEDIRTNKTLGFKHFRFSIAWTRIFPDGVGEINTKGVEFYHKVIDCCKQQGITPWVTLYHWDLPQKLEDQGGWTNRKSIEWFESYVTFCAQEFGPKVKNWIVMNEPAAFVGLGYLSGYHAPGKKNPFAFLKATHHVCMSMSAGGRILKSLLPDSNVGTSFSCSAIHPKSNRKKDLEAVKRLDVLLNRLYIEPILGMGYPTEDLPGLKYMERYIEEGDLEKLRFDFDFVGLQNYFRVVGRFDPWVPFLKSRPVPAEKRNVSYNEMGFEIYPEGMYEILKQFNRYELKNIIITENGTCVEDELIDGIVRDVKRIEYFESYLEQVLKAKQEGVPIRGYFVWSLTDNFEWSEGYTARFGLVHVDFKTQQRTIKDSGYWFNEFLEN